MIAHLRLARGSSRSVLLFALGAALASCTGGCAKNNADSPTGGWGLSLRMNEPKANQSIYYELERNGRLMYVAGQRAKDAGPDEATPTWVGVLTPTEAAPITAHLESDRHPANSAKDERGIAYRATLRPPGGWSTDVDSGPTPFLDRLRALLDSVQRARRTKEFDPR